MTAYIEDTEEYFRYMFFDSLESAQIVYNYFKTIFGEDKIYQIETRDASCFCFTGEQFKSVMEQFEGILEFKKLPVTQFRNPIENSPLMEVAKKFNIVNVKTGERIV